MDQHPIPQDVTGFQFKLIGTMTVKQFGYVATGVILAVVLFYAPFTGFFGILTKVILIPILGGSGAIIAFVPIEGRPVDIMATNFFKAIVSPNQFVYHKQGRKFSFSTINIAPITVATTGAPGTTATSAPAKPTTIKQKESDQKEAKLRAFLESSHSEVKNSLDKKKKWPCFHLLACLLHPIEHQRRLQQSIQLPNNLQQLHILLQNPLQ